MRLETAKLVWDVDQAAGRVIAFVTGKTFDEYARDDLLRSAVERQLEIVGEALAQLRRIDPEVAERVPDLRRIVDFRNLLIHGYAIIDDRLVWEIAQTKVPQLVDALRLLVREGSSE